MVVAAGIVSSFASVRRKMLAVKYCFANKAY